MIIYTYFGDYQMYSKWNESLRTYNNDIYLFK
jgi:hypothetical protein